MYNRKQCFFVCCFSLVMVGQISNPRHKFHYWLLLALVILGYVSQLEVSYLGLVLICNRRIIFLYSVQYPSSWKIVLSVQNN
jgi:hypothetical protein